MFKKEKQMSELIKHTERELKISGIDKSDNYNKLIAKSVRELIKLFSDQGHSGMSAAITLSLFKTLAAYKTITPLQGTKDEWNQCGGTLEQNNRDASVFRDISDGKLYCSEAIVWKSQDGSCFIGRVEKISSAQYFKSFPFSPQKFYIDVIEKKSRNELESGSTYTIKNKKDLNKVWEVYERPNKYE